MESKNIKSISLEGSTESNGSKKVKMPSTVNQDESNDQNPWMGIDEEDNQKESQEDLPFSKDTKTVIIKKEDDEN
jgi:hypothetical protein